MWTNGQEFDRFLKGDGEHQKKGEELWDAFFEKFRAKYRPRNITIMAGLTHFMKELNVRANSLVLTDLEKSLQVSYLVSEHVFMNKTILFHLKLMDSKIPDGVNKEWKLTTYGSRTAFSLKARSHTDGGLDMTEIIMEATGRHIPNPHSSMSILASFLINLGFDTSKIGAFPNILHSFRCVAQISYKIPFGGQPQEGDTLLVKFDRIKDINADFLTMGNYFEIALRQLVHRLRHENYFENVREEVTKLWSHGERVYQESCPCPQVIGNCPGSFEFMRTGNFCPYFFA